MAGKVEEGNDERERRKEMGSRWKGERKKRRRRESIIIDVQSVASKEREANSLLAVPERTTKPEWHDKFCHAYHHGTNVEIVTVHREVAHHHVVHQQGDDQPLHECIGDHTQH